MSSKTSQHQKVELVQKDIAGVDLFSLFFLAFFLLS